jgi:alpha-glucosidase
MPNTIERMPSTNDWDGDEVLQIYPHTFNEARKEGEVYRGQGNLRGIIEKVDFIKDMGYDAIWISPFYPSPMNDGGYDISDYTNIDERLGTLEDFDELIAVFHAHDIKVMIDLVPNHTSDQHEWFKESRQSRDNPKSDWYIWHDGIPSDDPSEPPQAPPLPPNNWSSVFSFPNLRARERGELIVPEGENTPPVSAWQWDETRQQFYLRDFDSSQPNLNWANPDVRNAIKDVVRFWIDRGVDGIRVDVANHLGKNLALTNEAPNPDYIEGVDNPHDQTQFEHSLNYMPTLRPYLAELASVLRERPELKDLLTMILECWMDPELLREVNGIAPDIASTFNFTLLRAPWVARIRKQLLKEYYDNLPDGAIPNQVLSNHDVAGLVTRFNEAVARAATVLNHSLPGMIFTYMKELPGLPDTDVPQSRQRDDGLGERDAVRTPMPWKGEGSKNAGFSEADEQDLWLPMDPRSNEANLEAQAQDPDSSLSLHRALIHTRKANEVIRKGGFPIWLDASHEDILAFTRHHNNDQMMTLVNFSDRPVTARLIETQRFIGRVVISSVSSSPDQIIDTDRPITLQPNEAIIALRTI